LETNKLYKLGVTAINIIGESARVESQSFLTATVTSQPPIPILKSRSKSHLEITWQDPINLGGTALDYYIVEMDSGTSG